MKNNINRAGIVAYSDNNLGIEPDIKNEPPIVGANAIENDTHGSSSNVENDIKEDLEIGLVRVTRLDSIKKPTKFCEKSIDEIFKEITGDSLKESTKMCRKLAVIKHQAALKAEHISEEDDNFEASQKEAIKRKREYNR